MNWSDQLATKTAVFLDGVQQFHVIEATPGQTGAVRKLLRHNGQFVFNPDGKSIAEVVEYGEVKLEER